MMMIILMPGLCVLSGSEPPSSPQVVEDGGEEDEEELSGGEEADFRSSSGRGSLLTRRGITLRVLLKDGLVEPGNGVLTIHYLVTHQIFISASACLCVGFSLFLRPFFEPFCILRGKTS